PSGARSASARRWKPRPSSEPRRLASPIRPAGKRRRLPATYRAGWGPLSPGHADPQPARPLVAGHETTVGDFGNAQKIRSRGEQPPTPPSTRSQRAQTAKRIVSVVAFASAVRSESRCGGGWGCGWALPLG